MAMFRRDWAPGWKLSRLEQCDLTGRSDASLLDQGSCTFRDEARKYMFYTDNIVVLFIYLNTMEDLQLKQTDHEQ